MHYTLFSCCNDDQSRDYLLIRCFTMQFFYTISVSLNVQCFSLAESTKAISSTRFHLYSLCAFFYIHKYVFWDSFSFYGRDNLTHSPESHVRQNLLYSTAGQQTMLLNFHWCKLYTDPDIEFLRTSSPHDCYK